MIILINTLKTSDKVKHFSIPFKIKTFSKIEREGNSVNKRHL